MKRQPSRGGRLGANGTVVLPDGISYEDAAPTMCAGYTVWAALRKVDPKPGARIAVVGIGGLGHLAIQYAKAAGFHVTAVTRTQDKHDLARRLGADEVIDDAAGLLGAGGATSSCTPAARMPPSSTPWLASGRGARSS